MASEARPRFALHISHDNCPGWSIGEGQAALGPRLCQPSVDRHDHANRVVRGFEGNHGSPIRRRQPFCSGSTLHDPGQRRSIGGRLSLGSVHDSHRQANNDGGGHQHDDQHQRKEEKAGTPLLVAATCLRLAFFATEHVHCITPLLLISSGKDVCEQSTGSVGVGLRFDCFAVCLFAFVSLGTVAVAVAV